MRICADHHTRRISVVLKDGLVNNSSAGFPETHVIPLARARHEVINFAMCCQGIGQIFILTVSANNQVIAMHCCWH